MDFLDPKAQRRYTVLMVIGYCCVAVAIFLATVVLLEVAYGFRRDSDGQIVQNGLVFVSSTPSGATIALSGVKDQYKTNTRISLAGGNYHISLNRSGYRPWQQSFDLEGGSVFRLDYPFLFPTQLHTTTAKSYDAVPGLATQSPDRRWLLVQQPGSNATFDLYDLSAAANTPPTQLTLPASLVTAGTAQSWSLEEWSDDNQHVLLDHSYDGKTEFILLDRANPSQSVNLNQSLGINPTKISLLNKKYNQYYVYDATAQTLQTAQLGSTTLQPFLTDVLAYQSYGSDIVLYASSKSATDGKVAIDLLQGGQTYLLREVAGGTDYLLDLTQYSGSWYVVVGASSENRVYIYKNPVTQLNSSLATLIPIYVLKTSAPDYVSFSASAQFIMAENGSQFSVYDVQYDKSYGFDTKLAVDAPQPHANWMDGDRLDYMSGGKLVVFDFDDTNRQTLMSASPSFIPFFSPDYSFVDVLVPKAAAPKYELTSTPLLTPADQ